MKKMWFGPGGVPGFSYAEGLRHIAETGLDALEIEFTYGVRMTSETAYEVGELAKKLGVRLSVHAPYYVNLGSLEPQKVTASVKRILDSCKRAHQMKATHVVYHSGFFQKRKKDEVAVQIADQTKKIMDTVAENGWDVAISPELTGKPTQFGSIPELLWLREETGCEITIDFAHQLARQQGKIDYAEIFEQLKGLGHIHAHFSGIEWTEKGERKHKPTGDEDMIPLLLEAKKSNQPITFINEAPDPVADAKKMKERYFELK